MKASIEFELPEEHESFLNAVNAHDYKELIVSLLLEIRNSQKYDAGPFAKCDPSSLETVREWLQIEIMDKGVDI